MGGAPKAGALLQLSAPGFGPVQTVSDELGRYAFFDVPVGRYTLVVRVNGAVTETHVVEIR